MSEILTKNRVFLPNDIKLFKLKSNSTNYYRRCLEKMWNIYQFHEFLEILWFVSHN